MLLGWSTPPPDNSSIIVYVYLCTVHARYLELPGGEEIVRDIELFLA